MGRSQKLAIQGIGPGMVGALNSLGSEISRGFCAKLGTPVTAHIEMGPDGAGFVPDQDDLFLPQLDHLEITRGRDLFFPARQQPKLVKDLLQFLLVDIRAVVIAPG